MTNILVFIIILLTFTVVLSNISIVFANEEFLIGSWNLKNFGTTRAYNDLNLGNMTAIVNGSAYENPGKQYDVIFVQELLSDGIALDEWCQNYLVFMNYACDKTPEIDEGTNRKESYGIIYKNHLNVTVQDTRDLDPPIVQGTDYDKGQMVRPPMRAIVEIDGMEFFVYNNHIKPSSKDTPNFETPKELENLEQAIYEYHGNPPQDYVIVLGDLNADGHEAWADDDSECGQKYLYGGFEGHPDLFSENVWLRIFTINDITNFAQKPCSYDKIMTSNNMKSFYVEKGIIDSLPRSLLISISESLDEPINEQPYGNNDYKAGDKEISDHRLIWAKFNIPVSESVELEEYENLGMYGSIFVVIGGIVYEFYLSRNK